MTPEEQPKSFPFSFDIDVEEIAEVIREANNYRHPEITEFWISENPSIRLGSGEINFTTPIIYRINEKGKYRFYQFLDLHFKEIDYEKGLKSGIELASFKFKNLSSVADPANLLTHEDGEVRSFIRRVLELKPHRFEVNSEDYFSRLPELEEFCKSFGFTTVKDSFNRIVLHSGKGSANFSFKLSRNKKEEVKEVMEYLNSLIGKANDIRFLKKISFECFLNTKNWVWYSPLRIQSLDLIPLDSSLSSIEPEIWSWFTLDNFLDTSSNKTYVNLETYVNKLLQVLNRIDAKLESIYEKANLLNPVIAEKGRMAKIRLICKNDTIEFVIDISNDSGDYPYKAYPSFDLYRPSVDQLIQEIKKLP